ncbi:MAG: hypothetical protein HZB15_15425 [Actinobacteria bacterium]|nr:hypothetical protein [Actinomycetota bacterium]
MTIAANRDLRLYGRPGEPDDAFAARCRAAAEDRAHAEIAKLKDQIEARIAKVQAQMDAAEDRAEVLEAERSGKRNEEILSTMGSVLGGLFGTRRSRSGALGQLGRAAGRRGRTAAAGERLEAAHNKVNTLSEQLLALEGQLQDEITEIEVRWLRVANDVSTIEVPLERSDVKVTQLVLGWLPIA